MVSMKIDYFDLARICASGQIFRMYDRGDDIFDVYSCSRHIRLRRRKGNRVDFFCTPEEFDSYWKRYFDLDRDYGGIVKEALKDAPCPEDQTGAGSAATEDRADDGFHATEDQTQEGSAATKDPAQDGYEATEDRANDGSHATEDQKKDRNQPDHRTDIFVAAACRYGAGIRILHQDIWEMLISFIISQQKQIPSIRKCIEALCVRFGERRCEMIPVSGDTDPEILPAGQEMQDTVTCDASRDDDPANDEKDSLFEEHVWYTFPTARAIAEGGPEGLKGLSLGYRERYIYETAVRYQTEGLPYEDVESMGLEAASAYFKSFCGVGEKVANCICLFGAGYVDAFPIDTHIKDILYREYYLKDGCSDICDFGSSRKDTGKDNKQYQETGNIVVRGRGKDDSCEIKEQIKLTQSDYEELVRLHFDRFKGYRGIVQQWIFAWELVRGKN